MVSTNEDALVCDFAETYGVFDYRALPVSLVATLAVGLRENSRIKMHINETQITTETMLLAAAVDKLSFLAWAKTKDAEKNKNRPKLIIDVLLGNKRKERSVGFETAKQYEEARARVMKHGN